MAIIDLVMDGRIEGRCVNLVALSMDGKPEW